MQRPENSGIQLYIKCLEGILVTPTAAYDKQVDENKCLLNVKKLSNEIIMGKTTEDTAMELDGEGAPDFEQLQDLIRKECDKCDRKYAKLEDKCNKLEQQVKNPPKKNAKEGPLSKSRRTRRLEEKQIKSKERSKTTTESLKKHSRQQPWRQKQAKPRKPRTSRRKKQRFQVKKYKQTSVAVTKQINSESAQLFWQEKTTKEATATKLIAQFGFVGDPTISKRHNTSITLANMPTWYYFSRPSNMAFHDFTKRQKQQKNLRSLLGLGLKFIPTPSLTNCWSRLKQSSYERLFRSVHLRFHFAGKPPSKGTTTYDPKIYVHSTWTPPHWTIPTIALEERLTRFSSALSKLFKMRQGKTNLLPHQHRAQRMIQQQQTFLIVPCDKNLGPAIIERHDYLKIAMRDHLSDTTTYKSLTTSEIDRYSSDITKNILGGMKTHHKKLTKMERAFLRKKLKSNQSPYARFYLTLKAHKLKPAGQTVDDLKSRPIVSCPGSLLHGLGVWVDRKLQEVAQRIVSYFKNTLELKKELLNLNLPRNARLFTADAVSMYTNILTHTALNLIGKYLDQYQRKCNNDYPKDAVRAGLRFVMTMNIFTFGDLTLKQLNGTAMGTPPPPPPPPAPPYATIYYGILEEKFLPHHAQ